MPRTRRASIRARGSPRSGATSQRAGSNWHQLGPPFDHGYGWQAHLVCQPQCERCIWRRLSAVAKARRRTSEISNPCPRDPTEVRGMCIRDGSRRSPFFATSAGEFLVCSKDLAPVDRAHRLLGPSFNVPAQKRFICLLRSLDGANRRRPYLRYSKPAARVEQPSGGAAPRSHNGPWGRRTPIAWPTCWRTSSTSAPVPSCAMAMD